MAELTQEQKDSVINWLSYITDTPQHLIKEDTLLKEGLGVDSLDLIELMMKLEGEFSCNIEADEFEFAKTVNDIYKILAKVI